MSSLSKQLRLGLPEQYGLYNPREEKDACGVGFVCDIKGRASNQIIRDAAHMNCCMDHRGGVGYEPNSGDGAGIMTGLPHPLFKRVVKETFGKDLPAPGAYGAGNVFLPRDEGERAHCRRVFEAELDAGGLELIGWREIPVDVDGADIGNAAREAMPHIEQLFVASKGGLTGDDLERALYVARKSATHKLRGDENLKERTLFYVCSLSTKIIIYKGMLTPQQVFPFYAVDLEAPDYETHLAMVHSRFSTNTFPSWDRAQPNRFMSHNGEINTLLGNKTRWLRGRASCHPRCLAMTYANSCPSSRRTVLTPAHSTTCLSFCS